MELGLIGDVLTISLVDSVLEVRRDVGVNVVQKLKDGPLIRPMDTGRSPMTIDAHG